MAIRTIGATLSGTKTCQHNASVSFDSSLSFDPSVANAYCVGGEIVFSKFRGWGKSYYFEIYIDGVKVCETREITDQEGSSTHELTTYINTDASFDSDALLNSEGDIEVVVKDNTSPFTDDVCSFRDGCEITINASYKFTYTRCTAPKTVTIEKSVTALATNNLSWEGASAGTNNAIAGYLIQYADSADNVTFGSWEDLNTVDNVNSAEVAMPANNTYRKYKVWTLGAAGQDYYSEDGTESASTYRGHAPLEGFTDSPLMAGQTHVKAIHMQELQDRTNTLRTFYGLTAYGFSQITGGKTDLKDWTAHVMEIRTALDDVLRVAGKSISTVYLSVDADGNATIEGADITVDANGDATIEGANITVAASGNATIFAVVSGDASSDWLAIPVNCPRADVIEQLRAAVMSL